MKGHRVKMSAVEGKLTFDAEGTEGGHFHSRKLHVPSANSGLTIGRGYDMKRKRKAKIVADLTDAGVTADMAERLSQASGLYGQPAEQFIRDNGLHEFEISLEAQEKLFNAVYAELSRDVTRICNKTDCVEAYGPVDWDGLNQAIKDVLVDLRFRGDYTGPTRRKIQRHVANNDLQAFADALFNRENWKSVPQDRFNRRVGYLQAALRESES
jgi:hypothetical protein